MTLAYSSAACLSSKSSMNLFLTKSNSCIPSSSPSLAINITLQTQALSEFILYMYIIKELDWSLFVQVVVTIACILVAYESRLINQWARFRSELKQLQQSEMNLRKFGFLAPSAKQSHFQWKNHHFLLKNH